MSSASSTGGPQHSRRPPPSVPRPSSSVILISPENHVLLLCRVKTSTSFASAHVFPGGNVSEEHDGRLPAPDDLTRHDDSDVYRMAAIRETFEESGILLACRRESGRLIELDDADREAGRREIHANERTFPSWLRSKRANADLGGLIPFTRWVTPTNIPKRFSTQMYVYFLPLTDTTSNATDAMQRQSETVIPAPTHDGGKEHTAARFLPASTWLRLARKERIILFPPQFFLLHMIAPFLSPHDPADAQVALPSIEERQKQRQRLRDFLASGDPPWRDQVISPVSLPPASGGKRADGRIVLGLDKPGPELKGRRIGNQEHVVLVDFKKEGPTRVEVRRRRDVIEEGRGDVNKQVKL